MMVMIRPILSSNLSADSEISEAVREAREGREIADILIIAAALLLVAELAVAQRPGRESGVEIS